MLKKALRKFLVLALAWQLILPSAAFAVPQAEYVEKTKEEVLLIISKSAVKSEARQSSLILMSAVILSVYLRKIYNGGLKESGIPFTKNMTVKEKVSAIRQYINEENTFSKRGIDPSATNGNRQLRERLLAQISADDKKIVEAGLNPKKLSVTQRKKFLEELPKNKQNPLYKLAHSNQSAFSKEVKTILAKLAQSNTGKNEISHLIYKLDNNLLTLAMARGNGSSAKDIAIFEDLVSQTMKDLSAAAEKTSPKTKKMISKIINNTSKRVRGRSGAAAIITGGVLLIGASLLSSTEDSVSLISNTRALIEEELQTCYKETPELLSAKTIILAEIGGLNLVSGIVYENQSTYGKDILEQLELLSAGEIEDLIKELQEEEAEAQKLESLTNTLDNHFEDYTVPWFKNYTPSFYTGK